jgi:2-(1,2-epoxy-1,2-dihydrophenyl)acetyl-CoA isomerase
MIHLQNAINGLIAKIRNKFPSAIAKMSEKVFGDEDADLRFALAANPETPGDSFLALTAILHSCITEIRQMAKPVIAAINGPAAGAGFFLALACDLRIIADSAYLKQSNTSHGLSLPAGGSFTLPRLVGMARALEIVMLDENMPAERALKLGLVNKVAPEAALLEEASKLAERVARMPVGILGRVKRLMNDSFWATLDEQLESERNEIAMSANSMEGREGISAFVEKRQPDFVAVGECQACEDGISADLFSADQTFPRVREALSYA